MTEKIRVLHVHTLPVVSGSGINTLLTMEGIQDFRYEMALACAPGGDLIRRARESGIPVHEIRNFVSEVNPWKDLSALVQLVRLLRARPFQIVHTHNSKAGFLGRLAARWCKVPIVVHTVHGFSFHEDENPFWRWLFLFLERWAAGWCDTMIAISQPMVDWALEKRVAPAEKIVKIYSGIEIDSFCLPANPKLREHFGIPKTAPLLGAVSKLWEGKGHKVILDAMPRILEAHPDAMLVIVGEGSLRPKLESLVARKGLGSRVIFTGFRADVPEVTALFDVALLASFYEGMGRVILEAMAAGKPVVATRVGGIPDLVTEGVTGFLVPPGDPGALAEKVIRLLSDPVLRERMGRAGREAVTERFSARTMVREIRRVYDELLSQRGIGAPSDADFRTKVG
ncbi:MAG: glycosyltransferase family 4 protein [Acidobacteria bacterium]|nr:glycosyltransferase family 4 protein [Acidobacteriota bacterium]